MREHRREENFWKVSTCENFRKFSITIYRTLDPACPYTLHGQFRIMVTDVHEMSMDNEYRESSS
jgi:hypothetical protein